MLRFFSPNSHFKKSSRQTEFVLSLRKNKIPEDIGRWFAEIAEQKKLRRVYSCASNLSKAMCQDKLKLIDTHGFLWWNRKKDVLLCWVTIDALFFGRRKNRQMCQRIQNFSGAGKAFVFSKTPGSGITSVFYLETLSGTQMLSFFTVLCVKCAKDGLLGAVRIPDGRLMPIWSELFFKICFCLRFFYRMISKGSWSVLNVSEND